MRHRFGGTRRKCIWLFICFPGSAGKALTKSAPFAIIRTQTVEAIRKAKVNFEGVSWENISTEAKDFVLSLLKKDPKERLTAKAALKHPFIVKRRRLSTNVPDPQLADSIDKNLRRYVDSSDFKKIALLAIANRMSSEEIVELRKVFSEFDTSCERTISKEEFSIALFKHGKHTEDEIESLFSGIDVNKTDTILYTGTYALLERCRLIRCISMCLTLAIQNS